MLAGRAEGRAEGRSELLSELIKQGVITEEQAKNYRN
jgi:polyhydroxyalkanoate synthesis regulator phasin